MDNLELLAAYIKEDKTLTNIFIHALCPSGRPPTLDARSKGTPAESVLRRFVTLLSKQPDPIRNALETEVSELNNRYLWQDIVSAVKDMDKGIDNE